MTHSKRPEFDRETILAMDQRAEECIRGDFRSVVSLEDRPIVAMETTRIYVDKEGNRWGLDHVVYKLRPYV